MLLKKFMFIALLFLAFGAGGQTFQEFASFNAQPTGDDAGKLNFRIESMGFFQNNEYLGNFVDGYTLPGFLFRPKLTYSPTDDLYMEAGGHIIKYNGRDQMQHVLPWFSLRYRFTSEFSAIIGNLNQNGNHGLRDQLWEPERAYIDKPEAGLQFLYKGKKLSAQTWINWEQFIQKNDPYQEHFTAGVSGSGQLYQNSVVSVKVPAQILFYHQGGEININPNGPRPGVQTQTNFSAGWEMAVKTGERVKTVNLNGYWFGFKDMKNKTELFPFSEGHAYLIEAAAQTKCSNFSVNYWNAFQFIAPKGRLFYQSVSDSNPAFKQADRSIISAKYLYQKNITKDARVAFQAELYKDLDAGDLSYSYGFFIVMNTDFLLKRFK